MSQNSQTELIRQGAELFNRGEYFACHEVFEEAWMGARDGQRLFLQGLIQVAVALHHLRNSNPTGAGRLLSEGLKKLGEHETEQDWIEIQPLVAAAAAILTQLQSGGSVSLSPPPRIQLIAGA